MRVVVWAVVLSIAVAAPAAAQQAQNTNANANTNAPVATSTSVFSKASIDRAVAATTAAAPNATRHATLAPAAKGQNQKKSIWKNPWLWVIVGGGVAAALAIAYSGDGTNGGPY